MKRDSKGVAYKKMGHWKGDFVCEGHPMHHQWLANKEGKKLVSKMTRRLPRKEQLIFSVEGLTGLQVDSNPIFDEGAPTPTTGIHNAATLCDILGIPLILDAPREQYEHGWGQECHDARLITATWTLTFHESIWTPDCTHI